MSRVPFSADRFLVKCSLHCLCKGGLIVLLLLLLITLEHSANASAGPDDRPGSRVNDTPDIRDDGAVATRTSGASSSLYRPGMRNSFGERKLSAKEMQRLLQSLREKTGFTELQLDEAGFLMLGDETAIRGGSETARNLLLAAINGENSINLQSHRRSPAVAFARTAAPVSYMSQATGARIEVQPIEIDFDDFGLLRGDTQAIRSFDPALVVFHELCHILLDLRDPHTASREAGDCENYINRIRRELGLPERQNYMARSRMVTPSGGAPAMHIAELVFAKSNEKNAREWFYLTWETGRVGGKVQR